jgi:hypothetical protein
MTASTGWRRTGAGSRRAYFLRVCGDGVDWGLVRAAAWRRFFFFFFSPSLLRREACLGQRRIMPPPLGCWEPASNILQARYAASYLAEYSSSLHADVRCGFVGLHWSVALQERIRYSMLACACRFAWSSPDAVFILSLILCRVLVFFSMQRTLSSFGILPQLWFVCMEQDKHDCFLCMHTESVGPKRKKKTLAVACACRSRLLSSAELSRMCKHSSTARTCRRGPQLPTHPLIS